MKQTIFFFVSCLLIMKTSRGQDSLQHNSTNQLNETYKPQHHLDFSSEYLLNKSNKLKSTGWTLISVGAVLSAAGLIWYENTLNQEYTLNQFGDAILNTRGPRLLMVAGGTMMLISVPLFIQAGHYKNKSLQMASTLKLEQSRELSQSGISMKQYPSLGLKIQL